MADSDEDNVIKAFTPWPQVPNKADPLPGAIIPTDGNAPNVNCDFFLGHLDLCTRKELDKVIILVWGADLVRLTSTQRSTGYWIFHVLTLSKLFQNHSLFDTISDTISDTLLSFLMHR